MDKVVILQRFFKNFYLFYKHLTKRVGAFAHTYINIIVEAIEIWHKIK